MRPALIHSFHPLFFGRFVYLKYAVGSHYLNLRLYFDRTEIRGEAYCLLSSRGEVIAVVRDGEQQDVLKGAKSTAGCT